MSGAHAVSVLLSTLSKVCASRLWHAPVQALTVIDGTVAELLQNNDVLAAKIAADIAEVEQLLVQQIQEALRKRRTELEHRLAASCKGRVCAH